MTLRIDVALKSVAHGKLVRACVLRDGARATAVTFTGDFFLEPADVLDELNEAMAGATVEDAASRAEAFFAADRPLMLIGAGAEDFAAVVVKALTEEPTKERTEDQ